MPVAVPLVPRLSDKAVKPQTHFDDTSPALVDEKQPATDDTKEVDVQLVMEEAMRQIQLRSQQIKSAARPYGERLQDLAEDRPVLFTFLAILTVLSFIPLCFFAGFILISTLFVLGVAAAGICITMFGVLLVAGSLLVPVLVFTTFLSCLAVSCLIGLFLAHRLYLHLAAATTTDKGELDASFENISTGVREWVNETTARVDLPFGTADREEASSAPPAPTHIKVERPEHDVSPYQIGRQVQWGDQPAYAASRVMSVPVTNSSPDHPAEPEHSSVDEATPRGKVQA